MIICRLIRCGTLFLIAASAFGPSGAHASEAYTISTITEAVLELQRSMRSISIRYSSQNVRPKNSNDRVGIAVKFCCSGVLRKREILHTFDGSPLAFDLRHRIVFFSPDQLGEFDCTNRLFKTTRLASSVEKTWQYRTDQAMLHLGWWPSADEDMPPRHPVARCHMYLSHVLASDEYTIESQSARIDDVECVLLRNSLATDAIWLDPSNHFAIRRRELRSAEQGGIIDIWNVRQFEPASRLQDASAVSIGRIIEVTSKTHSKDTEYQECLIKIEDVKINQSHDEECSFVPPPGTLAINMDSESLIGVLDGGTELLEQNVKMAIQMRRPAGERRGLRQLLQSTVVGRNVRRVLVWFNCGIAIAATAAIVYSLWRHRRGRAEKFD